MSKKEWAVVGLVIGAGILLPILGTKDDDAMDHAAMEIQEAADTGPMKTVALDITGLT